MSNGATQSTEEAMDLLRTYRRGLIAQGRRLARFLIQTEGTTHSRRIYDEMKDCADVSEVKWHWLGAVFASGEFEWTGKYHYVENKDTNIHGGRSCKIWRLR